MSDEMRQSRIDQNLLKKEGTAWDVGYGENSFLLFFWGGPQGSLHGGSINFTNENEQQSYFSAVGRRGGSQG